jgi:hypothetical protein
MMLKIVMTQEEVLEACAQWLSDHGADLSVEQLKFAASGTYGGNTTTLSNPEVKVVAEVETTHITGPYR